ncbi:hypothetical protein TYRP_019498 [Tyrophagus putrescentiae]|nr:hypothetical protein TYRP_019498 [Tyrophagus putrescentiae]
MAANIRLMVSLQVGSRMGVIFSMPATLNSCGGVEAPGTPPTADLKSAFFSCSPRATLSGSVASSDVLVGVGVGGGRGGGGGKKVARSGVPVGRLQQLRGACLFTTANLLKRKTQSWLWKAAAREKEQRRVSSASVLLLLLIC